MRYFWAWVLSSIVVLGGFFGIPAALDDEAAASTATECVVAITNVDKVGNSIVMDICGQTFTIKVNEAANGTLTTVTIPPGPTTTVTLPPLPPVTITGTVTLPPITVPGPTITVPLPGQTATVRLPGETVTQTVSGPTKTVTAPGATVTTRPSERPSEAPEAGPTETVTTTATATKTITATAEPTGQPEEESGTIDADDPTIDLSRPGTALAAAGIGFIILVIAMILALWGGYALGYKDRERNEAKFLMALRQQLFGKSTGR